MEPVTSVVNQEPICTCVTFFTFDKERGLIIKIGNNIFAFHPHVVFSQ